MATLKNTRTGRTIVLRPHHTVGRSRRSDLFLGRRDVSGLHATIRWSPGGWALVDHASRNGTWRAGTRLDAGVPVPLAAGDMLAFGKGEPVWRLDSVGPPVASAHTADGRRVTAEHGLLALPDDEAPELTVYLGREGTWVAEDASGIDAVQTGATLVAGGVPWTLELPDAFEETWRTEEAELTVAGVALRFEVSRDEEYVALKAVGAGRPLDLGARAHNYTLLTLARIRLQERSDGVDDPGWVHLDDLTSMLKVREQRVNLDIFRARKALGKAGFADAASVVQRRAYHKTLRFGTGRVEVVTL